MLSRSRHKDPAHSLRRLQQLLAKVQGFRLRLIPIDSSLRRAMCKVQASPGTRGFERGRRHNNSPRRTYSRGVNMQQIATRRYVATGIAHCREGGARLSRRENTRWSYQFPNPQPSACAAAAGTEQGLEYDIVHLLTPPNSNTPFRPAGPHRRKRC